MLSLTFTQSDHPEQYNPIKSIDVVPSIYASSKLPRSIDINNVATGSFHPLHELIDKQANLNLPFILSIKHEDGSSPKKHSLLQKTGRVYYFTINNKYENTFKYLGKSQEKDKHKKAFLDTFMDANKGCAKAQVKLAEIYDEGLGVTHDFREALRYYSLSALQGDLKAQLVVAKCISQGLYVDQDHEAAVIVYKYLADHFHYPEAQYLLAKHYENGVGIGQDLKEAEKYRKLAAEQQHVGAILALLNDFVQSDKKDYEAATVLIKKLVKLNYGKTVGHGRLLSWCKRLDDDLPEDFFNSVKLLYIQSLGNPSPLSTIIHRPLGDL